MQDLDDAATTYTKLDHVSSPPKPGDKLGQYEIDTEASQFYYSGADVIPGYEMPLYFAKDLANHKDVTIKVLRDELLAGQTTFDEAVATARALSAIKHPNLLLPLSVLTTDSGLEYEAVEFKRGDSLRSLMPENRRPPEGPLYSYFDQICAGMQALHDAGFTHGSLNLATFLITSDGHACVRDFTLCKKIDLLAAAKPGQKKRLPIYASPEMLMGESIDQSADIYAFGCCLYEFLTGANPFGSREDPLYYNRQLREDPEIPAEFARERIAKAILCCMQKNPADRYQSMTELRNAIVHHFDTRALRRDLLGTAADTKQPIVDLTQYTNAVLRPSGGDEYEPKTIFSAQQKSSNLPVLIEVQASWAGENSPKQRRSIELISKVHHANVESIIEQGDNDDFAYCFVIEDIAREPLSKHLEKVGKLSPAQFRHIFSQVCEGLQAIHEAQIVHTTITSEGLLLSTDGKEQVVISDCFNCKDFNHDDQRSRQDSSEPEREVGHISPEGLKEQPRDVRHDIYGLGACMYRALVGHELFESPNLMEKASKHLTEAATIPGDVEAESKELAAIILKCLEKEPDARYKTAEEVQKALQN